jgi:hypothetical protein
VIVLPATSDIRQFRSRNCPQSSVLAPMIRGEPGMVGLLLGSRELLCFCLVGSRERELYLLGESVSCPIQG